MSRRNLHTEISNVDRDDYTKQIKTHRTEGELEEKVPFRCFESRPYDLGKEPTTECYVEGWRIDSLVKDMLTDAGLMSKDGQCKIQSGFEGYDQLPERGGDVVFEMFGDALETSVDSPVSIHKEGKEVAFGDLTIRCGMPSEKVKDAYPEHHEEFDGILDFSEATLVVSKEELNNLRKMCS